MDGYKVTSYFSNELLASATSRNKRGEHVSVGMVVFFMCRKKWEKKSSCFTIFKLFCDTGCFIEKGRGLILGHISTATELDELNCLQF
jgi:hypothetical protein